MLLYVCPLVQHMNPMPHYPHVEQLTEIIIYINSNQTKYANIITSSWVLTRSFFWLCWRGTSNNIARWLLFVVAPEETTARSSLGHPPQATWRYRHCQATWGYEGGAKGAGWGQWKVPGFNFLGHMGRAKNPIAIFMFCFITIFPFQAPVELCHFKPGFQIGARWSRPAYVLKSPTMNWCKPWPHFWLLLVLIERVMRP